MKVCTKCNQEKPLEAFAKRPEVPSGYRPFCKECANKRSKEWRDSHPDLLKERRPQYHKTYAGKHPERIKERSKIQNKRHRKKKTESAQRWRHKNPDKVKASNERHKEYREQWMHDNVETVRECQREWRKNHPDKVRECGAIRRAREAQATPSWLTKEHRKEILTFYKEAKDREEFHETIHHVDHIEPLKGVNENREHVSCGLHVPWNLQVLTDKDNYKKSNKINQNLN